MMLSGHRLCLGNVSVGFLFLFMVSIIHVINLTHDILFGFGFRFGLIFGLDFAGFYLDFCLF